MNVYQYIEKETDAARLYGGIRAILSEMDSRGRYPEDWEIKRIQRLADNKYNTLMFTKLARELYNAHYNYYCYVAFDFILEAVKNAYNDILTYDIEKLHKHIKENYI